MGTKFFYTEYEGDIYVYQIKSVEKQFDMTLFRNEAVIENRFGFTGEFKLGDEKARLRVINKLFSSKHEFRVDNMIVELKKIGLKSLRQILSSKDIYNEVNPTKAELALTRIKVKHIIIPFLFLLLGSCLKYYFDSDSKWLTAIAILPMIIAGLLFNGLLKRKFPSLKDIQNFGLAVIILTVGAGFIFAEKILESFFG